MRGARPPKFLPDPHTTDAFADEPVRAEDCTANTVLEDAMLGLRHPGADQLEAVCALLPRSDSIMLKSHRPSTKHRLTEVPKFWRH